MATMMSSPANDVTTKFLFLNKPSGMTGSSAQRSANTNSTKHATHATASASASGEAHPALPPPTTVNITRQTVPPMSSAVPTTSRLNDVAARFARGRNTTASTMAASAMGTLSQKM